MVPEAVFFSPPIDQPSKAVAHERASGVTERWALGCTVVALVILRIIYAFVYRVDSDEPQHLHVVWGWAHGLLQYRDLFDNHSPLFQMLCAPLFRLVGEHAWIVVPMRLAMLPLFAADVWLMYLIGSALYVRRWGAWMALVGGCVPQFFLVTTEFRTDDLWTTVWLVAVWLAATGPLRGKRAWYFGLVVGTCFSVSMKTTLLLLAMSVAGLAIAALHGLSRRRPELLSALKSLGLIAAGILVVPALIIAFFAAHGADALHQMYYCVIQHNTLPGLGKWAKSGFHQWLFPLSIPMLLGLGWLCMHSSASASIGAGRAFILITAGAYYFLLRSYWPLVTAQDFIPILPLVSLAVLPFFLHLLSLTGWPARVAVPAAALVLLAAETAWIVRLQSPFDNEAGTFAQNLAIVLRITDPGDMVMDGKGETIFRNRPTYWVMEGVTLRRIQMGLIPDDVRASIIRTGTCVAVNHRLRPEDQDWLHENFIECDGKVWIAGKLLGPARPALSFHTDIPGKFSIVSDTGAAVSGQLDGEPLQAAQQIPAGDHQLRVTGEGGSLAIVWSQALERGFDPFTRTIAGFTE